MKSMLSLFVVCSILAGCLGKQIPNKKDDAHSRRENAGVTKTEQHQTSQTEVKAQEKVILDVPLIPQNPELKFGCEVTSLTMVLKHAGIKVNKMQLADGIKKDNDPLSTGKGGDITRWGDPQDGFVGDMTGKKKGYAVYVEPMQELMERYLPGRTVNLTRKSFDEVLEQIRKGKPVVLWTTGDYKVPDRWESWKHGNEQIKAPLDLHAVVLVGFEPGFIYINDPLAEKKTHKVNRQTFIQSWDALGQQALSYR